MNSIQKIAAVALLGALTVDLSQPVWAEVLLPVEVIGSDGFIQTVTLPVGDKTGIDKLWMRVHALDYEDKGSIQFNGGAWIPLKNDTVQVAEPGKTFGGIGGGFSVLEVSIPLSASQLVNGDNTLSFRFNHTDNNSSGYRVLEMNLFRGSVPVLSQSLFQDDNPAAWTPPSGADAIRGKVLYWTVPLIDNPNNPTLIAATCNACHTRDGRDLKYFSFSNHSIIERSKFHGLTEQDGKDIAAYIRLLQVPTVGRPWDPPYQPGSGTNSKPVTAWAGGAGRTAVLTRDQDLYSAIFPGGAVNKTTLQTTANLDVRQLPIALPLPDWNHWMPRTGPEDLWGSAFTQSELSLKYQQIRSNLQSTPATAGNIGAVAAQFKEWADARKAFITSRGSPATPQDAEKIYATALWQLTKAWEIMQEFDLEKYGQTLYGPQANQRSWFIDASFAAAPDALGIPRGASGLRGGGIIPSYLSTVWMQLQLVLTPHRSGDGFIQWPAYWGAFRDLSARTSFPEAMRFVLGFAKAGQITDNGLGPDSSPLGWSPGQSYDISRLVHPAFSPLWSGTPSPVRASLAETFTDIWLEKSRQYTRDQYRAGGYLQDGETPDENIDGRWVDRLWSSIPRLRQLGVSEPLIGRTLDWAKTLWPQANWETLRNGAPAITGSDDLLAPVKIFPNPYKADRHTGGIQFSDLPANSSVQIFTVSGHHIRKYNGVTGTLAWDLKTDSGDAAASGIYLFLIKDGQGGKRKGKVVIVK